MSESLFQFLRRVVGGSKKVKWTRGYSVGFSEFCVADGTDQWIDVRLCEQARGGVPISGGAPVTAGGGEPNLSAAPAHASLVEER